MIASMALFASPSLLRMTFPTLMKKITIDPLNIILA